MNRLTDYKGHYCFMSCYENEESKIREECPLYNVCYERKMYNKLCDYEVLEEQGYKMVNIDKVVEQLKQERETAENKFAESLMIGPTMESDLEMGKYIAYKRAIEIVKGGGNNEDGTV